MKRKCSKKRKPGFDDNGDGDVLTRMGKNVRGRVHIRKKKQLVCPCGGGC